MSLKVSLGYIKIYVFFFFFGDDGFFCLQMALCRGGEPALLLLRVMHYVRV